MENQTSVEGVYRSFEEKYLPFANQVAKELNLPKIDKLYITRSVQGVYLSGNNLSMRIVCPDADDDLPFEGWNSYYSDIALLLKEFQTKGKGFLPADVYGGRTSSILGSLGVRLYGLKRGYNKN